MWCLDDAGNRLNLIGSQSLSESLDDGDAACHRGLESHLHPLALSGREDFIAVDSQEGLVGRDHMDTRLDGGNDQASCIGASADQLHQHIWPGL